MKGSRKLGTIACFIALYVAVSVAGVVASLCAPRCEDGSLVTRGSLGVAAKLEPSSEEALDRVTLYFEEPVDDLVLIATSRGQIDIEAGSRLLSFSDPVGPVGTVRVAQVDPGLLVGEAGRWRLTLSAPADCESTMSGISLCTAATADLVVGLYGYCLPLVQGVYVAIGLYGLLLYRSKRERPLLMFSLYVLLLFLWGAWTFAARLLGVDPTATALVGSMLYGATVFYGMATCVCFCGASRRDRDVSHGWYVPLVVGALVGVLTDPLPPLFDSVLVIAMYMAGGVALLATIDGMRRPPRAVLYGLSVSQGLRTAFLVCSLTLLPLPLPFEIVRQMHLLAMPYVIGCLIDTGGAFSKRFREAEAQAVELDLINRELDRRVEARTQELVRQQELRASVLANLFHDCKTPLSIMRGALALMRDDATCHARQAEVMERQVANLTDIVDELFAAVKLQDGTLLMDTEPVALEPLVKEVVSACAVEAAARNIRVTCSCASSPITWGDEMWLGRALQNLVANAVNFSKEGGSVEVGLRDDGLTAEVTVEDHGAGIDPSDIDKVFDRYYRTAKERTSRQSSGLGLSIAQGVVQKHGGSIGVESVVGSGTVFTMRLPVWGERDCEGGQP